MDTAFPYSQYVSGKHFVGRRQDVTLLGNLLSQGEHVCLYEPPKTGKTSLVQQTLFTLQMAGRSLSVGQFSALNIRSAEDFLLRLGATVLRMNASSPEEFAALVKQYLDGTHFVFDPRAYADHDQVLSAAWELDAGDVQALLQFPFRLAQERERRMALIVDAFENVLWLDDPDRLLRPLAAAMQQMRESRYFSFVFCGSGVNAMASIFESGLLFRRLVERVRLSPVELREMADHVHRGFLSSGKVVEKDLLEGACQLFRGHVWYINHFAAICDSMTRGYIMEPVLVEALNCLVSLHEPRFRDWMGSLTTHQVNLLRAVVDGFARLSTAEVIHRYGLHSSANVKRVKDALMKKEILVFDANDVPSFQDPLFEYWIKKYYFEIKG